MNCNPHHAVTLLFSMRTISLASLQICCSVDADVRCKAIPTPSSSSSGSMSGRGKVHWNAWWCFPWCLRMDLGPILEHHNVFQWDLAASHDAWEWIWDPFWSITMHSNGTLPWCLGMDLGPILERHNAFQRDLAMMLGNGSGTHFGVSP